MKSHKRSLLILHTICILFLGACSSEPERTDPSAPAPKRPELLDEVQLKEDRSQFSDMRKDIPEDVQSKNDELALVLEMFKDKREPGDISSKFGAMMNKKREEFSKREQEIREDYSKREQKRRDSFMKGQQKARDDFGKKKATRDERSEFYSDIDAKRQEFFANERDSRREFDSTLREKRSDFDAHMKDLRGKFDENYRDYSRDYYQNRKFTTDVEHRKQELKAKKQMDEEQKKSVPEGFTPEDMKDLESIPKTKKPLAPDDE